VTPSTAAAKSYGLRGNCQALHTAYSRLFSGVLLGIRTTVAEQEWYRLFEPTLFVNVMDIECAKSFDIDVSCKLGKLGVESSFVFFPVISVIPAVDETFQVREGDSVGPSGFVELVGESGKGELLLEEGYLRVGDRYSEGRFVAS